MKYHPYFFVLLFLFFAIHPIFAQQGGKECYICKGDTHKAHDRPYKNFSFKSELPFLVGIIGLGTTSQLLSEPSPLTLNEISLLDKNEVNSFDRYAISKNSATAQKASNFLLTGVLVLPAIFISNQNTRKDLVPLVIMSAEVILLNYSLTEISKRLVKRTRPLAYNPNFSLEEKTKKSARVSFFSGHTSHTASLSFLIAKVMTDYHPHAKKGIKIGIWTFAAAIPAVTSYLRIRAGKHFPTDTITGFVAGGLVGILVPHFHKNRKHAKHKKVTLTPSLGIGAASLTMQF